MMVHPWLVDSLLGESLPTRIGVQPASAGIYRVYRFAAPHLRIAVREHGVPLRRLTAERGRRRTDAAIESVEDRVVQQTS